jgi:hypothetical protein
LQVVGVGMSKRSLLRRAEFKPQAPRSRLPASQLGLERPKSQSELSLADAMHQLDAGDRNRRI